jgi:hypothetical protein
MIMFRRFNPFFRNTRTEKHVPRFPGAAPNSPGLGVPVTPALNVPDASGQIGPVFAQGAQGAFGLQAVDVVLTSAQILALLGTPVTLVPAPPAGFMIVPIALKIIFFGGTVAYTNAGGAVNVKVGATLLQALTEQFITTVSPNRSVGYLPFAGTELQSSAANPPDVDGAALTINKITNNYAAGNGTAKVTVYYVIEPTT